MKKDVRQVFVPKMACTVASGGCFTAGECLDDCMRLPQREHIASDRCWCDPVKESTDAETGISVWLHRMMH